VLIKEKRLGRFSPLDFIKRFRAVRRNRERIDKRKTPQGFFAFRLTERFRVVRRNRERIDKRKTSQEFFASGLKRVNPSNRTCDKR